MAALPFKKSEKPDADGGQGNTDSGNQGGSATQGGDPSGGGGGGESFQSDPRKANKFFEHAETVADARNYDYAVDCYVNGLKHDPDNLTKHEALREVAMRRKVAGGKPPSLKEKLISGGKTPIEKMLHAERLMAMEPLNLKHMLAAMKHAADAHETYDNLSMGEVAYWLGGLVLEINNQQKRDKSTFLKAKDYFAQIGAFDKAVEACKYALQLDPNNANLFADLKNLEAERTMMQGGYGEAGEEGGFRKSVRDASKQSALDQEDRAVSSASALDEMIQRVRTEYEDDPQDVDKLSKLVDVLLRKADAEAEKEAVELLEKAHEQTGEYRYHVRKGDLRMKQYARLVKQLRKQLESKPDDEELKKKLEQAQVKRLKYELQEYRDRVSHYPTDVGLKFELGKRLFQAGEYDEAIGMFQQATADARIRAQAHLYLGSCFIKKQWYDEAIDTIRDGIQAHKAEDDRLALELRYALMDALENRARRENSVEVAKEARQVASDILQADINFRDIKTRMDAVRKLAEELSG